MMFDQIRLTDLNIFFVVVLLLHICVEITERKKSEFFRFVHETSIDVDRKPMDDAKNRYVSL